MESMTGYAFIEKRTEQFSFSIELKSLNSKYLETNLNLPRVLRAEENEIEAMLKNKFSRGKLELNVDIYDWSAARPVSINRKLLKRYYMEIKNAAGELGIDAPFSIDALLSLDGVLQKEKSLISDRSRRDIYAALETVAEKAIKMRRKEGASTARDIMKSLSAVSRSMKRIEDMAGNVSKMLYGRLKKSIESLAESRVDDVRLYTEVAILADKQDINEEIVRLMDHVGKMKQVLAEKGQAGKRLDFLAQEMFREITTISSKSNSSEISHLVVDIKNQIDKIREQSRNIV
jgi:uncharacterized protein (TIGR00255 family)